MYVHFIFYILHHDVYNLSLKWKRNSALAFKNLLFIMCIFLYGCNIYDENPICCKQTHAHTHKMLSLIEQRSVGSTIQLHHLIIRYFFVSVCERVIFLVVFPPFSFQIRGFQFNGFFIVFKRLVVLFCQNMQYFLRQNLCLDTPLLLLLTMYCVIAIHCIKILPLSCAVFAANKVHGLK